MVDSEGLPVDALFPLVYDELREVAEQRLRGERGNHTLQPTALVHEAWIRLNADSNQRFADRDLFLRAAASAMRRILIDHARRKVAAKRGGGVREETLEGMASSDRPDEILAIDEALEMLAKEDPRKATLVELRFFGGLELTEIADSLGVSERTLKRDWAFAKAWLYREISRRS